MKKSKIFLLLLCLWSSIAFSQTIISDNQDTSICFSLDRGRWLLKQVYKVHEQEALLTIRQQIIQTQQNVLYNDSISFTEYRSLITNKDGIIAFKDLQITSLQAENATLKRTLMRQKLYKWLAIGISGALIVYVAAK